jgi:hypothetical protein
MLIVGILLILIGIYIYRFLNKPKKPAIAVFKLLSRVIPAIIILVGIILFIIGIIKAI